MKFYGTAEDLEKLIEASQNLHEIELVNAFNTGYECCNNTVMQLYNQADAAIEQNLINDIPAGQNLFITLLQKANKMKDTSTEN